MDNLLSNIGEKGKDYYSALAQAGDLEAWLRWAECCEATGEKAEGLIVLNELLKQPLGPEMRFRAIYRKAVLQMDHPKIAWKTLSKANVDGLADEWRGRWHIQRGRIKKELRQYDPAIEEYTAARYYWELHGDPQLTGHADNNLSSIYRIKEMYNEAHESVDRAIQAWLDYVYLPQALDQKALIYTDEGNYAAAKVLTIRALCSVSDRLGWKAEFLCTLAKCLAGLGEDLESLKALQQAHEISEYLNDKELRLQIFKARKDSLAIAANCADRSLTELALELSAGNARQAAQKIGVFHAALLYSAKKHALRINGPRRK